jgi:hypothetical protein
MSALADMRCCTTTLHHTTGGNVIAQVGHETFLSDLIAGRSTMQTIGAGWVTGKYPGATHVCSMPSPVVLKGASRKRPATLASRCRGLLVANT